MIGYTATDDPDFTSIKVPLAEIGRQATEHLIKLLGTDREMAHLPARPLPVTLIDMGSTAPPPS
jgi:DNA-binding LacI/PurR family transcriptional regulator